MVGNASAAVTVSATTRSSLTTAAAPHTRAAVTTRTVAITIFASTLSRLVAIVVSAGSSVAEGSFVVIETTRTLTTAAASRGYAGTVGWGSRSFFRRVAFAMTRSGLVDSLGGWIRFAVRVLVRGISQ
jgi:hypothetical protein